MFKGQLEDFATVCEQLHKKGVSTIKLKGVKISIPDFSKKDQTLAMFYQGIGLMFWPSTDPETKQVAVEYYQQGLSMRSKIPCPRRYAYKELKRLYPVPPNRSHAPRKRRI